MSDWKISRNYHSYTRSITFFFSKYKYWIIFLAICALVGLVSGVLSCSRYSSDLVIKNITDKTLYNFLCGDSSWIAFCFLSFLGYISTFGLIFVINLKVWLIPINFVIIMAKGYLYGFDITLIIIKTGVMGILNCIIILIPVYLLSLLLWVCYCSVMIDRVLYIKKYGVCCSAYCNQVSLKQIFVSYIIISAIICSILAILLSFIVLKFLIIT